MVGLLTGILNCFLLFIQLRKIWKLRNSESLSLLMFIGFTFTNIGVSFSGFQDDNFGLGFGMAISAVICICIIISQLILRKK